MRPRGSFRIGSRPAALGTRALGAGALGPGALDAYLGSVAHGGRRVQRILESLRNEIVEGGGGQSLRIRQVFRAPREIYRLEFELPELGYQRMTLLDRDALEELLEADDVRAAVRVASLDH